VNRPMIRSLAGGSRYAGSMTKRPYFMAAGDFLGCVVHLALTRRARFESRLLSGCVIMHALLGTGLREATLIWRRPISW
jgi:hypothetical protein